MTRRLLIAACLAALAASVGCAVSPPKDLEIVTGFEVDRYLGTWYEIARLDHRFERGLTNIAAQYAIRPEGGIAVLNRGYDPKKGEWTEARGKAFFLGDPSVGSLKVSFFGPFYGGYFLIALDRENYRWAMVAGPGRKYLWILARERTLDPAVRDSLVAQARRAGFPTDELIWVEHDMAP